VGIITWDTSYGRSILKEELYSYAKTLGIDIVGVEVFNIKDVDITTQLLKLRSKKADYLLAAAAAYAPTVIKKTCKEMGWKVNQINVGIGWNSTLENPDLFEGDIAICGFRSYDDEEHPSIVKLMKYFKKNNRAPKVRDYFYAVAWYGALVEHRAMTEVVNLYGWEGFNAENIVKVMTNMKDFEPLGGLTKITYTKDRRTPRAVSVNRVTKGKLIPVGKDFMEAPDLRPEKYR